MVNYPSLVTRVHPPDHWEEILPGTNGQLDPKGGTRPASQGEGLRCAKEPTEAQEPT
jgi:hypothetical protein